MNRIHRGPVMSRGKVAVMAQQPAGSPNTVQGVTVLGYGHGDAAGHPVMTYVIR